MAKIQKVKIVKTQIKPEVKSITCPLCKAIFLCASQYSCVDLYGKCASCVADDGSLTKLTEPASNKTMRRK